MRHPPRSRRQQRVFDDVLKERRYQDRQWGQEIDDTLNTPWMWCAYVCGYAMKWMKNPHRWTRKDTEEFYDRMIRERALNGKLPLRDLAPHSGGALPRARSQRPMNHTVGILALLLLCSCSDNMEKDLAACKLEAIQIYEPGVSELKWDEPILSFIGICMTAAGYIKVDSQTCSLPSGTPFISCWRPRNWW
jgi:hypothetical protein